MHRLALTTQLAEPRSTGQRTLLALMYTGTWSLNGDPIQAYFGYSVCAVSTCMGCLNPSSTIGGRTGHVDPIDINANQNEAGHD